MINSILPDLFIIYLLSILQIFLWYIWSSGNKFCPNGQIPPFIGNLWVQVKWRNVINHVSFRFFMHLFFIIMIEFHLKRCFNRLVNICSCIFYCDCYILLDKNIFVLYVPLDRLNTSFKCCNIQFPTLSYMTRFSTKIQVLRLGYGGRVSVWHQTVLSVHNFSLD